MKLLQVDTLEEARNKLRQAAEQVPIQTEEIPLSQALGRILARDVRTEEPIPNFRRSSVDGYAVRSADTAGATESIPVFLEIVEDVAIGHPALVPIRPGTCSYVPTGGMIPEGADAMVMVEYSELFDENHVAINTAVSSGRFVVDVGEDMKTGELVLSRGTQIGPAQVGALAAVGTDRILVYRPWRVAVISTGDELVPVESVPGPGQVRDINTWALEGCAAQCGMELVLARALEDQEDRLEETVRQAAETCDLLLVSGGSSQGKKDVTMEVLDRVSGGGVFTHGLALKPGKPTILGCDRAEGTILAGLPGHPSAALTVFCLLFRWLWRQVTGQPEETPVLAHMETNLASAAGKATCLPVKLIPEGKALLARPILGKSGLITTLSEADGYILVDMNREGLKKGEPVWVRRYF